MNAPVDYDPHHYIQFPQPFDQQARYVITWAGSSCGVMICSSFHHMQTVLHDTYPDEDDPVRRLLLSPIGWLNHVGDDKPFTTNVHRKTNEEEYVVSIYRVVELAS